MQFPFSLISGSIKTSLHFYTWKLLNGNYVWINTEDQIIRGLTNQGSYPLYFTNNIKDKLIVNTYKAEGGFRSQVFFSGHIKAFCGSHQHKRSLSSICHCISCTERSCFGNDISPFYILIGTLVWWHFPH